MIKDVIISNYFIINKILPNKSNYKKQNQIVPSYINGTICKNTKNEKCEMLRTIPYLIW
jgi:hypothetical protein